MRIARLSVLLLAVALLAGCGSTNVIVVAHPPAHPPDDSRVVYVDDDVTIKEIDAASALTFSASRADHLKRIAKRPNLGPRAQVRLVDAAFANHDFDSHVTAVVRTLIDNPVFCAPAKQRVLDRLDELTFDSSRQSLLRAMDKRGPLMAFPEATERQATR